MHRSSCFHFVGLLWVSLAGFVPACTDAPVSSEPLLKETTRITISDAIPEVLVEDFDGDGIDDLALGVASDGGYPHSSAGQVHLLRGPLTSRDLTQQTADATFEGDRPYSYFGTRIAAVDLNGDSHRDLAIRGRVIDGTHAVHVVDTQGAIGRLSIDGTAYLTLSGANTLGQALLACDYNADGYEDLLISCPMRSEVSVVLGPRAGQLHLPEDADAVVEFPGGSLGWDIDQGDFNGDGRAELALLDPVSDTVYVIPMGLLGRHEVATISVATLKPTSDGDELFNVDVFTDPQTARTRLAVASRRSDSERWGSLFVAEAPLSGQVDLRRSGLVLEDLEVAYGVSTLIAQVAGVPRLLVGTPAQPHTPASALKGQLWALDAGLAGHVRLADVVPPDLTITGPSLGLDWLGVSLDQGRLHDTASTDIVVAARGAVILLR